jgi:hypothetical protein
MTRSAVAVSTFALCLVVGCASRGPKPVAAASAEPQGPVIVHLVGQHQTITVTSDPDGPLYSARTPEGLPIVANATLKELREQHPEVYRMVEPTMAVHADIRDVAPDPSKPLGTRGPASSGSASDRMIMLDSRR